MTYVILLSLPKTVSVMLQMPIISLHANVTTDSVSRALILVYNTGVQTGRTRRRSRPWNMYLSTRFAVCITTL